MLSSEKSLKLQRTKQFGASSDTSTAEREKCTTRPLSEKGMRQFLLHERDVPPVLTNTRRGEYCVLDLPPQTVIFKENPGCVHAQ